MKINSISSFNYNSNNINFKRSAIPYPEYANGYKLQQSSFEKQVTNVIDKIGAIFSPEVTDESAKIKSGIDNIYTNKALQNSNPKAQLMSVLA